MYVVHTSEKSLASCSVVFKSHFVCCMYIMSPSAAGVMTQSCLLIYKFHHPQLKLSPLGNYTHMKWTMLTKYNTHISHLTVKSVVDSGFTFPSIIIIAQTAARTLSRAHARREGLPKHALDCWNVLSLSRELGPCIQRYDYEPLECFTPWEMQSRAVLAIPCLHVRPHCTPPARAGERVYRLTSIIELCNSLLSLSVVSCVKWPYAVVREIHKRRYLLQHCALEVFSSDGRNQFLIFHTNQRDKLYHKLVLLLVSFQEYVLETRVKGNITAVHNG